MLVLNTLDGKVRVRQAIDASNQGRDMMRDNKNPTGTGPAEESPTPLLIRRFTLRSSGQRCIRGCASWPGSSPAPTSGGRRPEPGQPHPALRRREGAMNDASPYPDVISSLPAIPSLSMIPCAEYNRDMAWEVEYTDQFGQWWRDLSENQQDAVASRVELLMEHGPNLFYPYSSDIRGSRHGRMRELQAQRAGRATRVLYAFDPSGHPYR